jgi:hypothetical protein
MAYIFLQWTYSTLKIKDKHVKHWRWKLNLMGKIGCKRMKEMDFFFKTEANCCILLWVHLENHFYTLQEFITRSALAATIHWRSVRNSWATNTVPITTGKKASPVHKGETNAQSCWEPVVISKIPNSWTSLVIFQIFLLSLGILISQFSIEHH